MLIGLCVYAALSLGFFIGWMAHVILQPWPDTYVQEYQQQQLAKLFLPLSGVSQDEQLEFQFEVRS